MASVGPRFSAPVVTSAFLAQSERSSIAPSSPRHGATLVRHQDGFENAAPRHPFQVNGPSANVQRATGNVVALRAASQRPDLGEYTINVMAPLVVGDPHDMDSPASQEAWRNFEVMLREAKANGAECVSTDIWWGIIEPTDNAFNWAYYDRIADTVARSGLQWVPILSFHQLGGNVGDDAFVPLPDFLAQKYAHLSPTGEGPFSRSEQGNVSQESISPWASEAALGEFIEVLTSFQSHFADRADLISEINISMGPAGELRYPSYNSHDLNTGYPTRGGLQSYSHLAQESFRTFALEKYGDLEGVGRAWGITLGDRSEISPPADPDAFFGRGDDKGAQYGRDLFDWYNASLVEHGRRLLTKAVEVFNAPGAPFAGIDIGGKIPGIHWRIDIDRAAELTAGLIRSSEAQTDWLNDAQGRGYDDIVRMFGEVGRLPNAPKIVLHFTCLEMDDGQGGQEVGSRSKSLVNWVLQAAKTYGVEIKGENAIAFEHHRGWENIREAMRRGYKGLTVLRLPLSSQNLRQLNDLSREFR